MERVLWQEGGMDQEQIEQRLAADCSKCAALCCVALAFDRSSRFPFDKEAGEPCRNLNCEGRCAIHGDLAERGYMGCVQFHCQGAGPIVTQDLFGGVSWQQQPNVLRPMMEAFWVFLRVQEQVLLLKHAAALPLPDEKRWELEQYLQILCPEDGWSWETFERFDHVTMCSEVKDWLASLRHVLAL